MLPVIFRSVKSPHPPDETRKFGLVIVDMLTTVERFLTYPSSNTDNVHDGIRKLGALISFAAKNNIPVIFVVFPDVGSDPIKYLLECAGPTASIVGKSEYDAFTSKPFVDTLAARGVNAPIIAGFERTCCVLRTINGGLARGMDVYTSDSIMFGNVESDIYSKTRIFFARLFFKLKTNYFKSVEDLIDAVKVEMGIDSA